ncbi:MAG: hypothetical protein GC153_11220 [Alphaproteobacteria bacterium]|nr:hypothetical protein [Alphaproteobacteria bacterium]
MTLKAYSAFAAAAAAAFSPAAASADEQVFGYVRGVETIPQGGWEFYQIATWRGGKGAGTYNAVDTTTEIEYGVTDRFNASFALKTLSIDTEGLVIDGYLPGPEHYVLKPSGIEAEAKYNFVKPAVAPVGLSMTFSFDYAWLDPHSGRDKNTFSTEVGLQLQKYFLEGQLIAAANAALEATYADRAPIASLPAGFDWPTDPEMEIEVTAGAGFSYRFAPGWFLGAEGVFQTEFETEIGQERWSIFVGPSLHYAAKKWWATLTWFPQARGGGEEAYPGQTDRLHLVEKTKQEARLKVGLNF